MELIRPAVLQPDVHQECPICLEEMTAADVMSSLNLYPANPIVAHKDGEAHPFHLRCIMEWAVTKWNEGKRITCPVCRLAGPEVEGLPQEPEQDDLKKPHKKDDPGNDPSIRSGLITNIANTHIL